MKYFKKFNNNKEYEEYVNSDNSLKHAISYISDTNGIRRGDENPVIMTINSNPEVMNICYKQGWCQSPFEMRLKEALAVTNVGDCFKNQPIAHFNEFQFFQNLLKVDDYTFYNCNNLTSIVLPDSIQTIGKYAFHNCDKLSAVTIGSGCTEIDDFILPTFIETVALGGNIETIGSYAFLGVSNLPSIRPLVLLRS